MWRQVRNREDSGSEGRNGEKQSHKLTHPAVACFHSSSGTYGSLDCLKERPAFPHHLNRLVPLSLPQPGGFSYKKKNLPYPRFPSHFCLCLLIVSTRPEIKLSNSSFVSPSGPPPHPPASISYHPPIPTSSPSLLIHSPWSDTPPTHCLNPYQHVK